MNLHKGSILIVDDHPHNIEILLVALNNYGYEIRSVSTGQQAIEITETFTPDLILLDVMLPDMDGYAVCKSLKQNSQLQDVPVIFISSLSETLDKLKGFASGAVDYLAKPLEFEEVIARANAHITLYRQRQEIERLLKLTEQAEKAEREHRLMLNAMLDTATAMNSTLNLQEVLEIMLENVRHVVAHDTAMVITFEADWARIMGWKTYRENQIPFSTETRFRISDVPTLQLIFQTRHPQIIPDTVEDPTWLNLPETEGIRSTLAVPILSDDEIYGLLVLLKTDPHYYTDLIAQRLEAFTVYASIAIKNAYLYEQSQTLAVLEERQRLARELHDSVSQTLYSANNIAQSVLRFMDKKPEKVPEYLTALAELTSGAMTEMRSLLFELRSEAIAETEIAVLLHMLCDNFTSKTALPVERDLPPGLTLPPTVQHVFYRTAQEALNNVTKHSRASHVAVAVTQHNHTVELRVRDNGAGFDPAAIPAQNFGVKIMRERAASIQADFLIWSAPQQGTEIILRKEL
jgi:signal transduction histidine kinase